MAPISEGRLAALQIRETSHRLARGLATTENFPSWEGGLPRLLLTKARQTSEGLDRSREVGGFAAFRVATSASVGAVEDHDIGVQRNWHLDWHDVAVLVGNRVLVGVLLLHEVRRRGENNYVL